MRQQNKDGFSPLISACAKNSPESVKEIFGAIGEFVLEEERNCFVKDILSQKNKSGFTAEKNADKKGFGTTKEALEEGIKKCTFNAQPNKSVQPKANITQLKNNEPKRHK